MTLRTRFLSHPLAPRAQHQHPLIQNAWIRQGQNLLITGATGTGKIWLACTLGQQACRQGPSVRYQRLPRMFEELQTRHGDDSFGRYLNTLATVDLLILETVACPPCAEKMCVTYRKPSMTG